MYSKTAWERRLLLIVGLTAVAALPGCMVARPYGYVQVWSDWNTYGDSSFFIERVRTDVPSLVPTVTATAPVRVVSPTEQSQTEKSEAVADTRVPESVWIFQ